MVEMYSTKFKTVFKTNCINSKCELIDLPPFEYILTIKKDWYKNYSENIIIYPRKTINKIVFLEKQLFLTKKENSWELIENQDQISKFRDISFLQKTYKYFDIETMWFFYFIDNKNNTLTLYKKEISWNDTKLFTINKENDNKLFLDKVYQTDDEIVIDYWNYKYIINIYNWKEQKIYFPQKINYIKKDNKNYLIVNDKWTFIYNYENWKIEYFYVFKDFIQLDKNNYLWIIYNYEKEKINNYNLKSIKWENLIIKYNFDTKNIKVLETTPKDISKIVKENNLIYFYEKNEKYIINNIE